jgi:hypothetical protein
MIKAAVLNENDIVLNVIVIDDTHALANNEFISTDLTGEATIGGTYNRDINKFIPVKPYDSWTLQDNVWVAPSEKPNDGFSYFWNESDLSWVKMIPQV